MTDILSISPYAVFDGLPPAERLAAIKRREHRRNEETGGSVIATSRRARDLQAEKARILSIIEETAQRYSRASVTRVALDNLALEIRERG